MREAGMREQAGLNQAAGWLRQLEGLALAA
jgi:hypothetical protein